MSKVAQDFVDRLLKVAARNNQEYVLHQGHTLKKGQWVSLPNKQHVFVFDGKIQAGPPNLIGKNPKSLTPQDLSDKTESLIPQQPSVTDKYKEQLFNTQYLTPAAKKVELERLQRRMDSENDGDLTFFPGHENKNLDDLAKDFSDFGQRNPHDTPQNQAIWYNDRLQLMRELGSALGPHGKDMINPHMDNIQEKINKLKGMSGSESTLPTQSPAQTPPPAQTSMASPATSAPAARPKVKKRPPPPAEAVGPTPSPAPTSSPNTFQYPKPGEINQADNAFRPPTPPPPKPSPSPYAKKGPAIVDPVTTIPQAPVFYQMRGKKVAASQFKSMEMIQIEADLRNCFLDTMSSLGENATHPVTKKLLSHINKYKMQKF